MKRKVFSLVLALSVLVFALGISPLPAQAAGQSFHFSSVGKNADAGWTTCPFFPEPNQLCTDTYVYAADTLYKDDGTKFPYTILFIDQYSYKLDKKGNYVFVSATYGYSENATLSMDKKLTQATANGVVSLTTCREGRRGNWICSDAGTADVNVSWIGEGDLVRSTSNYHTVSKSFSYNSHNQGSYRNASAIGQMNGMDFGSLWYASLYDSKWRDVYVCHGSC